ncbi:MAG: M1 family metallopeptidase [Bacteroidetes bacterium]|nr:M1 family metallopeptidase [Bacteroidota bacterium]
MKKNLLYLIVGTAMLFACGSSQSKESEKTANTEPVEETNIEIESTEEIEMVQQPIYRKAETIYTDLIHTQLKVRFDWENSQMPGIATITAKPHFYPSDSLILDAKAMEIKSVKMNGANLVYTYTNDLLKIKLDKTYTRSDKYTVVIDYVAKPEDRKAGGSAAINSDKGLFFINPKGEEKDKMTHLWTQGETEASSVWFPTIDAPNVKTTQEIFMTVKKEYQTLSNGKFMGSKTNADGTKTDHWKQDLPHAPYLFMMAVGDFAVIEDSYTRKDGTKMPVNYFVEKEWAKYAKDIFGETPNMIKFFSDLLKVEYPWDKYHQIVVRDYVSGAMENTGAVIFGEYAYKTKRELLDGTDQSTIAHELFHHWFGDLVTAESWSNLTLNESFANYSQYLWDEHRYGLDEADYQAEQEANGYFQSAQGQGYHELVWWDYKDKEQMFDGHSYNKGGRILHMLRNYLGDEAFFEGISQYLKKNSFKAAEFHQLRLAFEEVSGEDLNWFFNQWYLAKGHPILEVNQTFDATTNTLKVTIDQAQDLEQFPLFQLPIDIAIHDTKGVITHRVWVNQLKNSFDLPVNGVLKGMIFDNQQMLLAKVRETKPTEQWIYQYYNSDRFAPRQAALLNGLKPGNANSEQLILDALNDSFWKIRATAIEKSGTLTGENKVKALQIIKNLSVQDDKSQVRSAAVNYVAANESGLELTKVIESAMEKDQSYMVISAALKGYAKVDPIKAIEAAKKLENENSSKMIAGIANVYGLYGTVDQANFFRKTLMSNKVSGFEQLGTLNSFTLLNSRLGASQLLESVKVYNYLAENGGFYTKMFMARNVQYLLGGMEEKQETLSDELADKEKSKDADFVKKTSEELTNLTTAIEEFRKLLPKEEDEE